MPIRTKLITNVAYSPTEPTLESQIRAQVDGSIQEVLDLAIADTTARKLSPAGDFTGTLNGLAITAAEPGLSAAFNAHTLDNARQLSGYVNVKQFLCDDGQYVKGDGIHDDVTGIQRALDYCHVVSNKVNTLYFPQGIYCISKPLLALGSNVYADVTDIGITIKGENMAGVTIKKTTSNLLGNGLIWDKDTILTCGSDYIWAFTGGIVDEENKRCTNIKIENITFTKSTRSGIGLYFPLSSHGIELKSLYFDNCLSSIESNNHFFLSKISYIRIRGGAYGINLYNDGVKTSLTISECYCMAQTVCAYAIKGAIYSNMINCCADGVTGIVFDLYFSNIALTGCGAESALAVNMYKMFNSTVTLISCESFTNSTNASSKIFYIQNSNVTLIGGTYSYQTTTPGMVFDTYATKLAIYNTQIGTALTPSIISENTTMYKFYQDSASSFMVGEGDYVGKNNHNVAFGFGSNPYTQDDGTDYYWSTRHNSGNVVISKRPLATGGIGWVITELTARSLGTVTTIVGNVVTLTDMTLDKTASHAINYKPLMHITSTNGFNGVVESVNMTAKTITVMAGFSGAFANGDYIDIIAPPRGHMQTAKIPILMSGVTSLRPTVGLVKNQSYYDDTLNIPIYWNGSNWKKYSDNVTV